MNTVFNNGKIALTKHLVFGLCVFCELPNGNLDWVPMEFMDKEDFDLSLRLLDNNPTFPWKKELDDVITARALREKEKAQ